MISSSALDHLIMSYSLQDTMWHGRYWKCWFHNVSKAISMVNIIYVHIWTKVRFRISNFSEWNGMARTVTLTSANYSKSIKYGTDFYNALLLLTNTKLMLPRTIVLEDFLSNHCCFTATPIRRFCVAAPTQFFTWKWQIVGFGNAIRIPSPAYLVLHTDLSTVKSDSLWVCAVLHDCTTDGHTLTYSRSVL